MNQIIREVYYAWGSKLEGFTHCVFMWHLWDKKTVEKEVPIDKYIYKNHNLEEMLECIN